MKIKLRSIVAGFLDSADQSSHQFRRLYNMGVRGMRQFNMDITGRPKTVLLDVNANKTVTLPEDCLTYIKMGIINDAGEIVTFTRNSQLSTYNAIYTSLTNRSQGLVTVNSGSETLYPFTYYNYWWNGARYNLFGLDSGTAKIGEFNVDEEAGVILLNATNPYSQILVEYVSNGYDDSLEDYEIDVRAEEAFIAWLRWNNAKDLTKKYSAGQVREYKSEYYREKRLANMRLNPVIISEMVSIRRANVKLVARA